MGVFDFDVDSFINQLGATADAVEAAAPEAINAISDVLVKRLREEAPFDTMNSYDDHLKDLIGKGRDKISKNGVPYQVIHIKKRGEKDKHIYKAVVAEYGRDGKLPDDPFWRRTLEEHREEAIEAGRKVIIEAIAKSQKK